MDVGYYVVVWVMKVIEYSPLFTMLDPDHKDLHNPITPNHPIVQVNPHKDHTLKLPSITFQHDSTC